jgi:hypothetical protein
MSEDGQSPRVTATGLGAVLVGVILINVLIRVVPLGDAGLPSMSLPDVPAWVDGPLDVIHTVVRVKNWLIASVVAVVIVGALVEQRSKGRRGG